MKRYLPGLLIAGFLLAYPALDRGFGWGSLGDMVPMFIAALIALGLNVVVGYTGLLNLSAAAFFGIGAYTAGILTSPLYPFQWSFWAAGVAAPAVAAAAGVLLGSPALRLRGDYLAIVTLGFGEVLQVVLKNLETVTKGTQGINPVAVPFLFGREVFPNQDPLWAGAAFWTGERFWYYLVLAALGLGVAASWLLEHSRLGRAWMAVREDELAATCMGVRSTRAKLTAFAVSAAFAGLAGAIHASYLQSTTEPGNFDFNLSIMLLCAVIIGGMGSIPGVLVGGFVIGVFDRIALPWLSRHFAGSGSGPTNILLDFKNWKWLLFGLALIVMMRLRPEGLWPDRRIREELRKAGG